MPMIRPETQTSRLLRKAANLLNSVAEAAWTNNLPSPAKWDLHRIGTEAYLAQRDILALLGLPAVVTKPQADFDIAAALDEAAQVVATIPEESQTLFTQWALGRVGSLAESLRRSRYCPPVVETSAYLGEAPYLSQASLHRSARDGSIPWDGTSVRALTNVAELASDGTVGTARTDTAAAPYRAVCITCRRPLTVDEWTDTHPECEATA
jgi:hypothetical protein